MRSHALLTCCCKNHHHHHHHHHHHICLNSFFYQKPVNKARSLRALYTLLLKKIQNTSTIILALNFCTHFKIFIIWRARQMPIFWHTHVNTLQITEVYACVQTLCLWMGFLLLQICSSLFALGNAAFAIFAYDVPMILIRHFRKDIS